MAHYGGLLSNIVVSLLHLYGTSLVFLPDIILDRGEPTARIRGVAYHEFTHASHFTNVGVLWYNHLTYTEFMAGGHGDGNGTGSRLCSSCRKLG
jgi:hypothetical protein